MNKFIQINNCLVRVDDLLSVTYYQEFISFKIQNDLVPLEIDDETVLEDFCLDELPEDLFKYIFESFTYFLKDKDSTVFSVTQELDSLIHEYDDY